MPRKASGTVQLRTTPYSLPRRLGRDIKRYHWIYLMMIPVLAYYIIFHYGPMYGAVISFMDYVPRKGIDGSKWVGFKHFEMFFSGIYAVRTIRNTVMINLLNLIFGFPAPIILALLLDELRSKRYRRIVQTITYMPHFISTIVVCGMIINFVTTNGVVNDIISSINPAYQRGNLLMRPELFRGIYVGTGIWQEVGWGSIVFLAALSGVDTQLYEAVTIDGGNRWHRIWHVSLPGILPTITILLIMRIGSMMSLGYEKIILLYNPGIYETADIISSYVYRRGLLDLNWSFASAVGLFNSVVNLVLVVSANTISRRLTDTGLW